MIESVLALNENICHLGEQGVKKVIDENIDFASAF